MISGIASAIRERSAEIELRIWISVIHGQCKIAIRMSEQFHWAPELPRSGGNSWRAITSSLCDRNTCDPHFAYFSVPHMNPFQLQVPILECDASRAVVTGNYCVSSMKRE
jgi:hypothetical protein